jgi:hypothetical protein
MISKISGGRLKIPFSELATGSSRTPNLFETGDSADMIEMVTLFKIL